jgi:hypothetical protein
VFPYHGCLFGFECHMVNSCFISCTVDIALLDQCNVLNA